MSLTVVPDCGGGGLVRLVERDRRGGRRRARAVAAARRRHRRRREEAGVGAGSRGEISLTHFGGPLVRLNLLLLEFVIVLLKERGGEELEVDVSRAPGGGREDVLP